MNETAEGNGSVRELHHDTAANTIRLVLGRIAKQRPSHRSNHNGTWLSLVERCTGGAEVAGSNPVVPTF
jgi:hypothetical protein